MSKIPTPETNAAAQTPLIVIGGPTASGKSALAAALAERLGGAVKATEPAVPCRAISDFRNVLAHNYLGIDPTVVWSVVEKDLPPLDAAIGRMLRTIDSPEDRS